MGIHLTAFYVRCYIFLCSETAAATRVARNGSESRCVTVAFASCEFRIAGAFHNSFGNERPYIFIELFY